MDSPSRPQWVALATALARVKRHPSRVKQSKGGGRE
jgi:hypothetical protein